MAIACSRLDHRDGGIFGHEADESRSAARDDHIDQAAGFDEVLNRLTRAGIKQLNRTRGNASHRRHALDQSLIAQGRFPAAAQDDRIARLQCKDCGVDSHVGTRLVDDPDDSERDAHLANAQAVRFGPLGEGLPDWIRETGDLPNRGRNVVDPRWREQEAIAHGAFKARALQILAIRLENLLGLRFDGLGDRHKQCILPLVGEEREFRRGRAGAQQFLFRGADGSDRSAHLRTFCVLDFRGGK